MVISFDVEPIQFVGLAIVKESKSPIVAIGADLLTKKQSIQIPPLIEVDFQSWNQVYII